MLGAGLSGLWWPAEPGAGSEWVVVVSRRLGAQEVEVVGEGSVGTLTLRYCSRNTLGQCLGGVGRLAVAVAPRCKEL